jgi:hypothetical protein
MEVSDQELRDLVRDAIARHTLSEGLDVARPESKGPESAGHASHGRFLLLAPTPDGQCVIEPAVRCTHCGYCQSYGH